MAHNILEVSLAKGTLAVDPDEHKVKQNKHGTVLIWVLTGEAASGYFNGFAWADLPTKLQPYFTLLGGGRILVLFDDHKTKASDSGNLPYVLHATINGTTYSTSSTSTGATPKMVTNPYIKNN